jgi:hypothetical protein
VNARGEVIERFLGLRGCRHIIIITKNGFGWYACFSWVVDFQNSRARVRWGIKYEGRISWFAKTDIR